ncbi:protein MRG1-like isoform X4 [Malania oleifera]|uniref:protein MRG1-like isoform X4 n=1 Tax=Malania oleifera TaxID=397392 RepID=UPI0025ADB039|nr:protein MRG1-like isoform X4 [Malania oleifera]
MGRSSNTGVKCDTVSDASVEAHGDDDQGRCIPPPSDSLPFSEGEKVLAYHKSSIYEAKGWSKNWDEWVCLDRLMKHTEENVQKQQLLNKKHGMDRNTKTVVRGKKLRNGSINKESVHLEKIVNIHIPRTLKKQLIDDCEYITHLGKLVKIPRSPNVDDILNKYLDYRLKKDGEIADSVGEVLKGLRCYFDKALPAMLLYKSEREQYQEAISDHVSPSTVYGAEHLLRLFVKLPELLFYANIEGETLTELKQKLLDFLKFLQKNRSAFFLSAYHVPEDFETKAKEEQVV